MADVIFKEDTHQYFNIDNNEEYISCTTLIGKFKKPFEKEKMATLCARKYNTTKEQILKEWSDKAKQSTDFGTMIHAGVEGFITNQPELYNNEYKNTCEDAYNIIKKEIGVNGLYSEMLIWNHKYKIAGQSDVVQFTKGNKSSYANTPTINIVDFKTNAKIDFISKYDDFMLYPLDHLQCCSYNYYSLQLSLYAYILQQMYPEFKIGTLFLLHLDKEKNKWTKIPCNYMLYEIKAMLNVFDKTLNK